MADFEFEADFSTGDVDGATFTLRPDAIVALRATAPGPAAIGSPEAGLLYQGWYVRPDNDAGVLYLGQPDGCCAWTESELFSYTGAPVEMATLAFDVNGYPVVAMERAGEIWVRYWDGGDYVLSNLGSGISPALIHRAPNSPLGVVVLLYEVDGAVMYRLGEDDYATEIDAGLALASNQHVFRAILGAGGRLHLAISTRNPSTGEYTVSRKSEPAIGTKFCLEAIGYSEWIEDGADILIVFREDGELRTTCEINIDALVVACGGDSGGSSRGEDSALWVSEDGYGLDPATDSLPDAHGALGGGDGGLLDVDGHAGGSGGGGGGRSPSGNTMWSAGGGGIDGQGHKGGGGQSTWGLLDAKLAASGGGGGYGTPGESGTCLQGSPLRAGKAGAGGRVIGWNWSGAAGGKGHAVVVYAPEPNTGNVSGGGGAGGVSAISGLTLRSGQTIPVRVGQGLTYANAGAGGDSPGGLGSTGMIVIRVRRTDLTGVDWAVLSGGTEYTAGGYKYHVFTSTDDLEVVTPGKAEVRAQGGGAGGGSGSGGGGGAGELREGEIELTDDVEVTVGAGGDGGTSGSAGENGGVSGAGSLFSARGGGGGAGAPTSAAGSDATGGGGHGNGGQGGAGTALRGNPGGDGGGFDLTAGGSAYSAGGGGGAGDKGRPGATQETVGGELSDNWEVSSTFAVNISAQTADEVSASDLGLLHASVLSQEIFVQATVLRGHTDAIIGVAAQATHPSGADAAPDGSWARLSDGKLNCNGSLTNVFGMSLGAFYTVQLYCSGSANVQEATTETGDGLYRASSAATAATSPKSWGVRSSGGTNGAGRRRYDLLMAFRTKYLTVGEVPTGGKAQVLNDLGVVVEEADESSGEAVIDCSRFGNGSTGAAQFAPLAGWRTLRVLDDEDATIAERSVGGIFPGGEYDVDGEDLAVRIDEDGDEPVPLTGLLGFTVFDELAPGPEHGDGGDGVELDVDWVAATGLGDADGYVGGGGGGGAEIYIAGLGGKGGGGAGAYGANTPEDGEDGTGGGGGGSGDTSVDGGDGGDGFVVVRVQVA